jgi:trigger factor
LKIDEAKVREHVEEMCAGYQNSEEMVNMYLGNQQIMQQIQPMVLEQQAFDWLLENGKTSTKKVGFTEYMNP